MVGFEPGLCAPGARDRGRDLPVAGREINGATFARKKDHGRAEAVLLAKFAAETIAA